jgi:hypothetical protein
MTSLLDIVEEDWGRSDATDALDAALQSQTDPIREFARTFGDLVGGLGAALLAGGGEADIKL